MKIIHLNQIDSTNAYLIRENTEYDDMTFVETDYQTNGKGRENRTWLAQRGENSMFSILIKDKQLVEDYAALSILAALLVRNYLSSYVMDKVTIKWPNDVYVSIMAQYFPTYNAKKDKTINYKSLLSEF